ncbi:MULTISPECIES: hypothetical protein [unclassified Streptomyces]|uniref:hypothetical protein n=1 Tax=unclassified Streptomyces TaxID=2593676 RepID=UPI0004CAB42A|nr:hypothetical protein [Streptomyces sp. NRRL F-2747]
MATAVHEPGEIAGYAFLPGEKTRAVRRDIAGRVGDLGSLEGSSGEPTAINDRGTVVGQAADTTGRGGACVPHAGGNQGPALPGVPGRAR